MVVNDDCYCSKRGMISDVASLLIFVLTMISITMTLWPDNATSKQLRIFFQDQGFSESLESEILLIRIFLIGAILSLILYFFRLSLSLQLYDKLPKYYHNFIQPLPTHCKTIEWFIRLFVLVILLLGLQMGPSDAGSLVQNILNFKIIPSASKFFEVSLFVLILFSLFLLWDGFYLLVWLVSKNARRTFNIKEFMHYFPFAHIMGFVTWSIILLVFGSEDTFKIYKPFLSIVIFVCLGYQFYDNYIALAKKRILMSDMVYTYRISAKFIFSKVECANEHAVKIN